MSNQHDENCSGDCAACGSDCETGLDQQESMVTLTLDDDTEVECAVLAIYPVGDKEYIALLPVDEEGNNEDGEVYLYRYTEVNGDPTLDNIEEDDEYEAASEAFDELLDSAEFDELVEGEDL
jgi:hypothetical protein